jgi:hypothetical protein
MPLSPSTAAFMVLPPSLRMKFRSLQQLGAAVKIGPDELGERRG